MTEIERSSLPWKVGGHPRDDSGLAWREVLYTSPFGATYVCQALEPDAEFIVRACNAHEDLLVSLEKIANELAYGSPAKAEGITLAAIAKARGE